MSKLNTTIIVSLIILNFVAIHYVSQAQTAKEHYKHGLNLIEDNQPKKALDYWLSIRPLISSPHIGIGTEFIKQATRIKDEKYYRIATLMYNWGIKAPIDDQSKHYFELELERLRPLMEHKDFKPLANALDNNVQDLGDQIINFWNKLDPTPLTNKNERLIEHWARINYALDNFIPDNKSRSFENLDDRARVFLKYGKPDREKDGFLRYNSGEIASYIRSRQTTSNRQLQDGLDSRIETQTRRLHRDAKYKIWVYNGINKNKKELIYIFGEDYNPSAFTQKSSVADFIPKSAYGGNNRNSTNLTIVNTGSSGNFMNNNATNTESGSNTSNDINDLIQSFNNSSGGSKQNMSHPATPASLLLLMYTRQLSAQSSFYGKLHDKLYVDYMDITTRLSSSMDYQYRNYEKHYLKTQESLSPPEISKQVNKIPDINNQFIVGRFLNNNYNNYVYIFANSELTSALNIDLNHNRNLYLKPNDYRIKHGLIGYKKGENKSLFREVVDAIFYRGNGNSQKYYANSTFKVKYTDPPIDNLTFSAELHNLNEHSKPLTSTTFDATLRGLGNVTIDLPKPLNTQGLELSDIIIGYDYKEDKSSKFPLKITFGKPMPIDKNIAFYFEAYGLSKQKDGLYSGELTYEIKKETKGFNFFKKNNNDISIKLNLKSDKPRYSNTIEIETSKLKAGQYTLTLKLENDSGNTVKRHVDFTLK